MIPRAFEYHAPTSVAEAASLLDQHGDSAKLLAGGHSLLPLMKLRLAQPEVVIDLAKISDLSYIRQSNGGLSIGAMTTYADIESSADVQSLAPALAETAGMVADRQVRNMGTIGGSLAHSDPAGDLPAIILALGAQMVTSSSGAHRTIAADDFFVDLFTTALQPNEILNEIQIPALPSGTGTAYAKFGNKASHYAIVGIAAVLTASGGKCQSVRIGITGAGAKATRATSVENALTGASLDGATIKAAAQLASDGIDFNEDVHASAEYRAHLTRLYTERVLLEAASRAG
ncbi:MAG: carbon monoxide dehydrogenase [SAR202 cluster bacterium Casp-Chloro-G4]|nr:xanthine dehydrogenase family protein subunit M [Chloroflexota bacterium]MDA1226882.1 xanthine dehydrogenase family protein subunit M [Chloroflexota bacterium]PKB62082.1 MAG: carbon monoxide dehydrogenase [SAR202 cluster bacterium Casp-Chloro-G4]